MCHRAPDAAPARRADGSLRRTVSPLRIPGVLLRLVAVVVVCAVGTAATVLALVPQLGRVITAHDSTQSLPELNALAERSVMFDTYGNVIGVFRAVENRKPVPLSQVPDTVREAVLAIEDADFYRHDGVNVRALIRATVTNVAAGGVRQGGSTITQQLVKNALVGNERDAQRKIREAMYALRLEEEMTKDEILERYLNTVYFGNGAYGVQAAAETYFGKDVGRLDAGEAALIAGLIRNPGGYDPLKNPERAKARRTTVLDRMVEEGWLTAAAATTFAEAPVPDRRRSAPDAPPAETYFVDAAKQALLDDPRLGATPEDRFDALFNGGLRIYTTFDPIMQSFAEQARDQVLPPDAAEKGLTVAVATVEPSTGAIKALVGGPGFTRNQYNIAIQKPGRQPGSSFKTFVLAAALERGARADDLIDATSPCTFPNPPQEDYVVRSPGAGVGPLTTMMSRSINCAFIRLGAIVGLDNVVELSRRLGITTNIEPFLSLSIGTGEVTPLEMATAYGVIANDGVRQEPYYVKRVEDAAGTVLFQQPQTAGVRVLDEGVARTTTSVLRGVVTQGTGRSAAIPGRDVVGKTGTTDDYTDAWFVGYTPELSTAVWMGSPVGKVPMKNVGGRNVTGGSYPAQIFSAYMARALENVPPGTFPAPPRPTRPQPGRLFLEGVECAFRSVEEAPVPAAPGTTVEGAPPAAPTTPPPPRTSLVPLDTTTSLGPDGRPVRQGLTIAPVDAAVFDCKLGPIPPETAPAPEAGDESPPASG